jgi:Guanylate-binding protein, N-terminal domain
VEEPEYGFPLPLMWLTETNHSIVVDYDNITEIFNRDEIANRKIVAVSIIGALRKGKSFFLAYCLRYMYANVSLKQKSFGMIF